MALWGNNDNISTGPAGVVSITSYTYNATFGGYPIEAPLSAGSAWGSEGSVSYTHLTLPTKA